MKSYYEGRTCVCMFFSFSIFSYCFRNLLLIFSSVMNNKNDANCFLIFKILFLWKTNQSFPYHSISFLSVKIFLSKPQTAIHLLPSSVAVHVILFCSITGQAQRCWKEVEHHPQGRYQLNLQQTLNIKIGWKMGNYDISIDILRHFLQYKKIQKTFYHF